MWEALEGGPQPQNLTNLLLTPGEWSCCEEPETVNSFHLGPRPQDPSSLFCQLSVGASHDILPWPHPRKPVALKREHPAGPLSRTQSATIVPCVIQGSGHGKMKTPGLRYNGAPASAPATLTVAQLGGTQPGRSAGRNCSCLQTEREGECGPVGVHWAVCCCLEPYQAHPWDPILKWEDLGRGWGAAGIFVGTLARPCVFVTTAIRPPQVGYQHLRAG